MLAHVPAGIRSEMPTSLSGTGVLRELDGEAGLTPLHLAAYSGDENVVRLLLNSAGVTVDQPSAQNVRTIRTSCLACYYFLRKKVKPTTLLLLRRLHYNHTPKITFHIHN